MPHGSPGANYVQYLAMAFRGIGASVTIVTNITEEKDELEYIERNGIQLQAFNISKKRFLRSIDYNYLIPIKICRNLEDLNICKDDFIVVYSRRKDILEVVLEVAKKKKAKTAACIVEWYGMEDVTSDEEYKKCEYVMENVYPKFDILIPISNYIEAHYKSRGCKTVYLPCMSDFSEFSKNEKEYGGKKRFVYPANGKMKDAISEMLEIIIELSERTLSQCEFNFCGIKETVAVNLTNGRIRPLIAAGTVIFHKWLSYKNLIELYNEMHFLFLLRKTSRMTLANFPSKVPETMTYGVTPVCSNVGDYTQIYLENKKDAIIVENSDAKDIVSIINRIAEMPWSEVRKLNDNSKKTAEIVFDYHNWLDTVRSILE